MFGVCISSKRLRYDANNMMEMRSRSNYILYIKYHTNTRNCKFCTLCMFCTCFTLSGWKSVTEISK